MRVAAIFNGLEGDVAAAHIHGPTTAAGEGTTDAMTWQGTWRLPR